MTTGTAVSGNAGDCGIVLRIIPESPRTGIEKWTLNLWRAPYLANAIRSSDADFADDGAWMRPG